MSPLILRNVGFAGINITFLISALEYRFRVRVGTSYIVVLSKIRNAMRIYIFKKLLFLDSWKIAFYAPNLHTGSTRPLFFHQETSRTIFGDFLQFIERD